MGDNKDESMEPICRPVKKCPIIFIDFGVEKCESSLDSFWRDMLPACLVLYQH